MSVPGQKQYGILRCLGNGCAMVIGYKREIDPLLRRGWVTAEPKQDAKRSYYAWIRITPDGLRALALAVEKYGLPDLHPPKGRVS